MPPKKSNLDNAYSNEARRKRVVRHHESAEEIVARNAAQRIRAAQSRAQESREQTTSATKHFENKSGA